MRTIKELADICNVSKTTIERTIKELDIKKIADKNRYVVSDSDAGRIVLAITDNVSLMQHVAPQTETQKIEQNITQQTETNTETNETQEEKSETNQNDSANPINSLIKILEKQTDAQQKTIDSLQEQNRTLLQIIARQSNQINELSIQLLEQKEVNAAAGDNIVETNPNEEKPRFSFWKWLFG